MLIANPIYDAVFKYLMEDTEIARQFLSVILEEDIVQLEMKPQEQSRYSSEFMLAIVRFDFKAIIRLPSGDYKTVLIELQKGRELIDVVRFRQYLADNYRREEDIVLPNGVRVREALPIVSLYFFGFTLKNIPVPIVRISRSYIDAVTKQELIGVKEDFVEKLTHDSIIVQIPRLATETRTRLETVLSIFNQQFMTNERRLLRFPEGSLAADDLMQAMTARLAKAVVSEEIRSGIEVEETFDAAMEREIRKQIAEREEKISEQQQQLAEQESRIQAQEAQLAEREAQLAAQTRELEELRSKFLG
jgi:hypothetical protein